MQNEVHKVQAESAEQRAKDVAEHVSKLQAAVGADTGGSVTRIPRNF